MSRDDFVIEITRGEDFVGQIFWTDRDNRPFNVEPPCRAEARDLDGNLVLQFATENLASAATKAAIAVTGSQGFLQLTCPKALTLTLTPGRYPWDLFATVNENGAPFDPQVVPVLEGWLVVDGAVTNMSGALV